jgi:Carboxypeptidase regulatory-like domain
MNTNHRTPKRLLGRCRGVLLCFLTLAVLVLPAVAQDAGFGSISGTVTDPNHSVVSGANVTVIQTDTGIKRDLQTTSTGSYSATFLKPGRYEVVVSATGFAKADRKNLIVPVGQIVNIDVELPVAGAQDSVTITGEAPLIDTEKVGTSQEIGQNMLANMPINGRRFDEVVLLTPNVAPDGTSGLIAYRGVSGLYNTNLIDGANNNQAFFSEARGRAIGAPYVYSTDSIQEFQSAASSYGAEFGQAAGGQINAVSKSGTNQYHGDLFYYLRYPDLNALDPYGKAHNLFTQPVHQQHQFGGSVGGPILHDKLFFFFTYDGFRKVNPIVYLTNFNFSTFTCPVQLTAAQCQAALNYINGSAAGIGGLHNEGIFPRLVKQDIFFPKVDWQLNPKNHISAEFNWQDFKEPNGYNTSNTVTNGGASQNGTSSFHERFGIANWTSVIGPTSVNQVLFQVSRDFETASTNTAGPTVSISGVASYGETSALPRGAFPDEHRFQVADIYSKTQGRHDLKAGLDFSFIHEYLANLFQGDGSYSYSVSGTPALNLASWMLDVYGVDTTATDGLAGRHYKSFTQVNDPITHIGADDFWNKDLSGFAQDRFKLMSKLQLSAGVRWDVQLVPQPPKPNTTSTLATLYTDKIHIGYTAFQPRVGFSYQGWKGGVVRGGYGMFVGLTSNSTYYTMRVENGVYQQQYNVSKSSSISNPFPSWAPQYTNVLFTPPGPALAAPFSGALTPQVVNNGAALTPLAFRGLDPNFKNPYSHSFDIAVEQELPFHSAVTLGYVGNRAMRLPIFVDVNLLPATQTTTYDVVDGSHNTLSTVTLPWYTQRATYADANLLAGFSVVNSWYHSFVVTLKKPMTHGIELLGNYTYSHATDGGQISGVNGTFNGTDTPVDPMNLKAEYGRSDLDMRSRVTGTFIFSPTIKMNNSLLNNAVNGWSMSGAYTAQSGNPVTGFMSNSPGSGLGVGDPLNTSGVSGDGGLTGAELSLFNSGTGGRVPQVKRNAFAGPGVHNLDARISRDFTIREGLKVQVIAEAFNLANHQNILSVNTNLSSYLTPAQCGHTNGCIAPYTGVPFGSASSTNSTLFGPRQTQFTAKFLF